MRLHPFDPLLAKVMRIRAQSGKRPRPLREFDPAAVRRILVVSSTAIGDTLFATPAWRAVRRRYPQARIIGHIRESVQPLFSDHPHLDAIIPYAGGYHRFFRTVRALRQERFDLALIFHGMGPQAIPMAVLSGAPFVIRIPNSSEYGYLLSNGDVAPENLALPGEHAIQLRLRTAGMADAHSEDIRMVLPVAAENRSAAGAVLSRAGVDAAAPLLGVVPGAATTFKRWPAERFAVALTTLLGNRPGWRAVILGSRHERRLAEQVAREVGPATVNLAGLLDLRTARDLISNLRLLLTNDTGPLHIAIAVGTPTVSMFGATDSRGTGPLQDQERHAVIQRASPAWTERNIQRRSSAPMLAIAVDEVVAAANDLLGRRG